MRPRKGKMFSGAQSPLPRKSKERNVLGLAGARASLMISEGLALGFKIHLPQAARNNRAGGGKTVHASGTAAGLPHKLLGGSQQNPPVL